MLNEGMLKFFNGFRYDAHPMAMLSAVVGSMSAYYHDEMDVNNPGTAPFSRTGSWPSCPPLLPQPTS